MSNHWLAFGLLGLDWNLTLFDHWWYFGPWCRSCTAVGAVLSCHCTEQVCPLIKNCEGHFCHTQIELFFGGGPPPLLWLVTLDKAFSVSSHLVAFSRNPGPKRFDSLLSYSSVASLFSCGLILDHAIFLLSWDTVWDTLPSRTRVCWIRRRVSSKETFASLFNRSNNRHVRGPVASNSCFWILQSSFSPPKKGSLPLRFNCSFNFWVQLRHCQGFTVWLRKILQNDLYLRILKGCIEMSFKEYLEADTGVKFHHLQSLRFIQEVNCILDILHS